MTGLKFSGVIVPDTDNQAAPGDARGNRAHTTWRWTK